MAAEEQGMGTVAIAFIAAEAPNLAGFFPHIQAKPASWTQFYRISDWEHKVNLTRLLLYVILGACSAGALFNWRTGLVLAFFGSLLMFAGAWSDYWDYMLEGQRNPLGSWISACRVSRHQALVLALAPLLPMSVCAIALWHAAVQPLAIYLSAGLALFLAAYAAPPFRFKGRAPAGFFAAPIGAAAAILIAWGAASPWNLCAASIALLVFVFHCYAECLHVLDDAAVPGETRKLSVGRAAFWARHLPLCSSALAALLSLRAPIFAAGVVGGLVRWRAIRQALAKPSELHRLRTALWSPLFCLPEFLIYGLAGALR